MGDKDVVKSIVHYQECLEKYARREDESKMLYCIGKLWKLPVTIDHLTETGVGRTVNSQRKVGGDVGERAKALVTKWKEMVAREEEKEESEQVDVHSNLENKTEDNDNEEVEELEEEEENSYSIEETKPSTPPKSNRTEEKSRQHNTKEQSSKKSNRDKEDDSKQNKKHKDAHKDKDRDTSKHKSKKDTELEDKKNKQRHKLLKRKQEDQEDSDSDNYNKSPKKEHKHKSDSNDQKSKSMKRKHEEEQKDKSSKRKHSHSENNHKREDKTDKKQHKPHKKKYDSDIDDEQDDEDEEEDVQDESSEESKADEKEVRKHSSKSHKEDKYKNKSTDKDKNHRNRESKSSNSSKDKDKLKHSNKDKIKDSTKVKHSSKHSSKDHSSKKHLPHSTKSKVSDTIVDGIGSGSGTSFAEALGMLEPSSSKGSKKKIAVIPPLSVDNHSSGNSSPEEPTFEASVLENQKLEPLDINISSLLPEITPNYKPMGYSMLDSGLNRNKINAEDETLSAIMYNKISRTKVYSGNKVAWGKVSSLFDICTRVLQDNIDALEFTGGVPYSILKPVLERANYNQLFMLEQYNPYLMEDTDELWKIHCQRDFRTKSREEMETWRDMYQRCLEEREIKLRALTANIKCAQDKTTPVRQTKLAYVDSVVKPPRNIARKQAKHGTGGVTPLSKKPAVTPSSRLATLATAGAAGEVVVPNPGPRAASTTSGISNAIIKPKKAPLMQKTLALMKNRFRR